MVLQLLPEQPLYRRHRAHPHEGVQLLEMERTSKVPTIRSSTIKYWRHQATGSLCKGDHRPGEGWYLLPNFDNSSINPVDEVKAQQSTVGESTQPRMRVMNPELTLRDHFAGLAMQEIMTTGKRELSFHQVADYSYKQADAMLEVRERYATTPAYSLPDDVSKSGPGA